MYQLFHFLTELPDILPSPGFGKIDDSDACGREYKNYSTSMSFRETTDPMKSPKRKKKKSLQLCCMESY